MHFVLRQSVRSLVALVLLTLFMVPTNLLAQSHVVSPADLQKQVTAASQARDRNIQTVQNFLSTSTAEKALKSSHIDSRQVRTAISSLDDQDLAQLAARADKAQADFAAGNLSDRDLIWIILGIAVLVLIIVAVR
jgi:biopolymer transport protein ExbD